MKYEFFDKLVVFIPEDDADVHNLGKLTSHLASKKAWKTTGNKAKLISMSIHISDLMTVFHLLLEKTVHHFVKRDL